MRPSRYQVLGPLHAGEGSRAQLGLAIFEDGRAEPCVVVPVPDEAEKDAKLLEKIRRETDHAAQLDHPNIVTVFGFGALGQSFARMVEFADGESLRRVLNISNRLSPRLAARIVVDACTGVHYAHFAGNDDGTALVHGDVRPETILLSFAGVTKVTGYGALAFAPKEIGGQRVKGRRVHSSPEQIIGGRDAITVPSDVYLLGLTFYELLTGVVPWADQGDGFDQAVLAYPLPPATPGLIPEPLQAIIEKACQKKSAQRYATPLAMREAIEAALPSDEIASAEELSKYLESLFPGSGEIRAERRRIIDAGIAEYARQQWARRDTRQIPIVHLPPVRPSLSEQTLAPVSAPAAEKPKTKPVPSLVARPEPREVEDDETTNEGSSTPWLAFLLVIVIAASGYFAWTKANEPFQGAGSIETEPTPVGVIEIDAGAVNEVELVSSDAGEEADAGLLSGDAGAVAADVIDAGPSAPLAPVALSVTIESRPALELTVDGNLMGKTPWTGPLAMGAHKVKLENKDLLLSANRTVTVQGDQAITQTFTFEKGTVGVNAPSGALIFIDGKKQGVAPLASDLSIYEGSHRILVKVGQAQWTETFSLFGGQRVSFNVELE
jgi:eukaryotic-like serine/threonine-protein kinase